MRSSNAHNSCKEKIEGFEPLIVTNDRENFIGHGGHGKPVELNRQLYMQQNPLLVIDRETLKMIQVMFEKGILLRDESVRPHLYRPAASQEETQLELVDDLVQKAFGGVAGRMVVRALSAKRISPDELAEIKKLIRQLEGDES